ncbi:subtilisin-like protease SBT3.6 isoform X1 [Ananas comosus]|uniref:Subtilisin-like protease SBT3.6 isoform X1 n=2 Tax=Ananas comosus TaxID=4615 RepID=A0A6P5EE79_ANACO|nr:subtilisin-like protease SBT3.6 isoform X1 [Ananas comosus]
MALASASQNTIFGLLLLQLLLLGTSSGSNVYIVYMGEKPQMQPQLVHELHHGILTSVLGSEEEAKTSILYSYKHGFSGFAAVLSESQAARLVDWPGVVRVVPNRILELHTTRSWDFLHLSPEPSNGLLSLSRFGERSIIGVLDTGIWPESESFKDDGMGEVPSRWRGKCVEGEKFHASNCNRKIIGARWYIKGYEAENGKLNTSEVFEFLSPRDAVGHGTHTSSTAAGALVANASFNGLAQGLARGGASRARLAIYKVCWATGDCSSADILAAFDDAIHDGVDVLSVSLGQAPPLPTYVEDVLAIGSFHAAGRGISVVCSAGNSGPYSQTVINTAPWIITVAASTIDWTFISRITLGNNSTFVGQTLYPGKHHKRNYQIVNAEDIASSDAEDSDARSCNTGSLNATLARGKIVLCFQTRGQRVASVAADTVRKALGVGVIFAQFMTKDIASSYDIPCIQVDLETGSTILNYIGDTRKPVVKFSSAKTILGKLIAPEVAYFSSRGPSSLSPSVLKPDIAAPGVNILAAWPPASMLSPTSRPVNFRIDSGTSMSCPHISAVVALLKSIHPDWSPTAIKSALVTTANARDEYGLSIVAEGAPYKQADAFDHGGGHVDPNKALDPGLVYDTGVSDYIRFLCSMGYNNSAISSMTQHNTACKSSRQSKKDLNLPSISIPELRKTLTVSRTVTNVGPVNAVYRARIEAPKGVHVNVEPKVLLFNMTAKMLSFKVTFRPKLDVRGRYMFGSLLWEDGVHSVRIPLVVRTVIDDFYTVA